MSTDLVDARDPSEILVQTLMREILGTEIIPLTLPFRDMGGSSFTTLWLHDELERATGRALDLDLLWHNGSVEVLARAIRSAPPSAASKRLVTLAPGSGRTIYCVHAIVGMALKYREFAELVSRHDIRVRAFQARGMLPMERPHTDIAAMAAEYVDELLSEEPEGITLLGYSMGGFIAYEMAVLLQQRGFAVDDLFIMDTMAPTERVEWQHLDTGSVAPIVMLASALTGDFPRDELLTIPDADRVAWLHAKAIEQGALPPGYRVDDLDRLAAVVAAHLDATTTYAPERSTVTARTTLLTVPDPAVPDDLWWDRALSMPPEVVPLPGPHYLLLDTPAVDRVAKAVVDVMTRVR